MKLIILLCYLLLQDVLLLVPSRAGIVYFVKPSFNSKCPGQPCQTLQYYFDNVDTSINQMKNVTMIFMKGTHSINISDIIIKVPLIKMEGQSEEDVLIKGSSIFGPTWINFIEFTEVNLRGFVILNWSVFVQITNIEHLSSFNMALVKLHQTHINIISSSQARITFDMCEFHSGVVSIDTTQSTVVMANCRSISNAIIVQNSTVELSGVSWFTTTNQASAISTYFCNITLSGKVLFANNFGIRGGAMALYSSTLSISPDTEVKFINNTAFETGGAIYIDPSLIPRQLLSIMARNSFPDSVPRNIRPKCFYQLLNCTDEAKYIFTFANNSAFKGGDDIYGASLHFHRYSQASKCNITVTGVSASISSVSSDPTRVCLCDNDGKPQCENNSFIFKNYAVHPGEEFTVPAVVVGGDYGATIGPVFFHDQSLQDPLLLSSSRMSNAEFIQLIAQNKECSKLKYSLHYYNEGKIIIYLTTVYVGTMIGTTECSDDLCFHTTPVFLNVTLLECPPGLTLLGEPPVCDCYPVLAENDVKCHIVDRRGMFSWSGNLWVNVSVENTVYSMYCPFNYCKSNISQGIDLQNDSDSQCSLNRAGRLCGGCMENYSLAIGSSHCIHCPNDNNLALLIFFSVAGFLLVFFISALNLTVTQGTINGLVFYANIVWIYQSIFFPQEENTSHVLVFLKTFIAWVNLDFGIETCFVSGLTAFWKTWLQFLFPFYIWVIAGLIILAARYSTRLTNAFGNRAVPVLDTLFLLSYMKLLRLVAATMAFSTVSEYPQGSVTAVWSIDGNLTYFGFPHILLFLAGLATLLFLWLPYTLMLFLMQWLRRLPRFKILNWIMQFHPVYDAYFAPLKHKHQYWFGLLLLVRGVLLLTLASTFTVPQNINLLLLLVLGAALLFFMAQTHPYKTKYLRLLHTTFILNLTLLSGFVIFAQTHPNGATLRSVAVGLSTGVAFLLFCGIVVHALVAPRCSCKKRTVMSAEVDISDNIVEPVADITESTVYRDSIFEEDTKPLLTNDTDAKYKQLE